VFAGFSSRLPICDDAASSRVETTGTSLYLPYAGVSAAGDAKWIHPNGINGLLTITIY
jgi:hypothetical protein